MPRNLKESLFFTFLMCAMMALFMSSWNLFLVGELSLSNISKGYLSALITAFLLSSLVVGPIVKTLSMNMLQNDQAQKRILLVKSIVPVLLMVSFMSIYGLLHNHIPLTPSTYGFAWLKNIVMAFPLSLFIVGPIARSLLASFQKLKMD